MAPFRTYKWQTRGIAEKELDINELKGTKTCHLSGFHIKFPAKASESADGFRQFIAYFLFLY